MDRACWMCDPPGEGGGYEPENIVIQKGLDLAGGASVRDSHGLPGRAQHAESACSGL